LAAVGLVPIQAEAFQLFQRQTAAAEATGGNDTMRLSWEKLVPPTEPLLNPYDTMPPEQQAAIETLDYLKSFPPGPLGPEVEAEHKRAQQDVETARKKLAGQGVDMNVIYRRYTEWQQEVDRRGRLTIAGLDAKHVAIAGYLLPLDFNASGTREFLLVPYVGACIHVPPPPPNQVIYVKAAKPYKVADMYDSVMVTGVVKVGAVSKDLSFMDGDNSVDAGYTLQAERIKPHAYEEGDQ
jgi:hypothetical protein